MIRLRFRKLKCVVLAAIISLGSMGRVDAEGKKTFEFNNIRRDKVWTVKFSNDLDKDYVKNHKAILMNSTGKLSELKMELGESDRVLLIHPPKDGYSHGTSKISIPSGLTNTKGEKIGSGYEIKFSTEKVKEITNIVQERAPFVQGQPANIFVTSSVDELVKYYVLAEDDFGRTIDITEGFTQSVRGNGVKKIELDDMKAGDYIVKVYMKLADEKGEKIENGINYHHKKVLRVTIDSPVGNYEVLNSGISFDGNYLEIDSDYLLSKESSLTNIKIENNSDIQIEAYQLDVDNHGDFKKIKSYTQNMNWNPGNSKEYLLKLELKNKDGNYLGSKTLKIKTGNVSIKYEDYNMTLDEFAKKEKNNGKNIIYAGSGYWANADLNKVKYYLNPDNFMDGYGIYQFMNLNYVDGMTVEGINEILEGRGILDGKGAIVLEAAKKYDINPGYLLAHMFLETGHGTSKLAKGVNVSYVDGKKVQSKTTYNMYGIRAIDGAPVKMGSEFAYKQGWFTPEMAIIEGAGWIGRNYINNEKYRQNTLYKMRWNKEIMWHQYSTDVKWAYGQIKRIKYYVGESSDLDIELLIPRYKK